MKKVLIIIWNSLDHKGRYATVIGIITAAAGNVPFIIALYTGSDLVDSEMMRMLLLNAIGWGWVILPSKISITTKAGFSLKIED